MVRKATIEATVIMLIVTTNICEGTTCLHYKSMNVPYYYLEVHL